MRIYHAYLNTLNEKMIKFLKKFDILSSISNSKLTSILPYLVDKTYDKGEIIFTEGDDADKFYFIESGEVQLSKLIDREEEEQEKEKIIPNSYD